MSADLRPDRPSGRAGRASQQQASAAPARAGAATASGTTAAGTAPPPARRRQRTDHRRPSWSPAWPVAAFLVLYPLWWALGLADYMAIILLVPMALRLYAWRSAGRPIALPPGFALWLLFLLCTVVSVATLSLDAPGTVTSSVSNRILSFGDRTALYLGFTALLIYAGNLTEEELPRRRLAWMLGLMAIYTVAGGAAAVAFGHFQFTSPLFYLLPHSFRSNLAIATAMHPGLSQAQVIVQASGGRPKAPFDFTNTWGNCLSLLVPFLVAGWWANGSRRQRIIAAAVLVIAIVPVAYSLNRGMWIGLGLSGAYLALRMAARGRLTPLFAMIATAAVLGLVLAATPLSTVISQRLANGQSNDIRSNLSATAITAAVASPVLGYGDTRREVGSPSSIAVGPTPNCPACGEAPVGSNGQLWLLLICVGFPGTVLYLGFFAYGGWRFWRDLSPTGLAGVLVLLLTFLYMTTYVAVGPPLAFTMLAYAVLWKNDQYRRAAAPDPGVRRTLRRVTGGAPDHTLGEVTT